MVQKRNCQLLFSFEGTTSKRSGGDSDVDTPVLIPNTEVKHISGDNIWTSSSEDSTLPGKVTHPWMGLFLKIKTDPLFNMIGSFFQQIMKDFSILYDSVYRNSPYISNMLCILYFAIEVLHTKGHYYLKISGGIL